MNKELFLKNMELLCNLAVLTVANTPDMSQSNKDTILDAVADTMALAHAMGCEVKVG